MNQPPLDNATPVDWQCPPAAPPAGEVHLWKWSTQLCDVNEASQNWLDASERERYARLVSDQLKHRFLVAHSGLRHLLASYLDCAPADVRFELSASGKPLLPDTSLHFNLSHTGELMVAAVSTAAVGVDVEQLRNLSDLRALAARHLTAAELASLDHSTSNLQARTFFSIWTRKEAVLKMLGCGLQRPPRDLEVGLGVADVEPIPLPVAWNTPSPTCWLASGWLRPDIPRAIASGVPIDRLRVFDANFASQVQ